MKWPVMLFGLACLVTLSLGVEQYVHPEGSSPQPPGVTERDTKRPDSVSVSSHTFSEFPLGVAFGFLYKGEVFMPYIKELGINRTKLYIYWEQIEPRKGQYDWSIVDSFLGQLDEQSEALIAVWSSSKWGTKQGLFKGGSAPINKVDYYSFVFNLVKHCRGRIRYWQNDCEPNSAEWWKGTKEEFVSTLRLFYEAVKDADPRALVIVGGHDGFFTGPSPGNQRFFDYVFREGKDYFDIFDIRLYADLYSIPYRVEWFRKRMKSFGFEKPIVCTEYGGPMPAICPDFPSVNREFLELKRKHGKKMAEVLMRNRVTTNLDRFSPCLRMFREDCSRELNNRRHRIHCRDIVSRTILALSCGLKKLWYWDLFNEPHITFGKFRLMDAKSKVKYPAFYAYERMAEKLRALTSIDQLKTINASIYLFAIGKSDGKTIYILWERRHPFFGEDKPPTDFELHIGARKVKVTDVFGEEEVRDVENGKLDMKVTDTPFYVEMVS